MSEFRRRQLLSALTAGGATLLAGCGSDASDGTPDDSDDESDDENGSAESNAAVATAVVEALAAGRFTDVADDVDDPTGTIDAGVLEHVWMGFEAAGGSFEEVVETTEGVEAGTEYVDVTMAFERGEDVLQIVVSPDGAAGGLAFNGTYETPDYVDQDAFSERAVTVEANGCDLDGLVTIPDGDGQVPGVVVVHGTGPADMNLENVATQAYRDLAEGLATQEIATLRYNKRTATCETPPEAQTLDHVTVDDALVAIERLREVEEVDADRIVICGHSQGGLAAPRIGDRDGRIAGIVGLATPARPFHELLSDQLHHLATTGEYEPESVVAQYEIFEDEYDRLAGGEFDPEATILEIPEAKLASIAEYDPIETANALDVPIALFQGERDYQVSVEDDLDRWRDDLATDAPTRFETYSACNHFMMPGSGPSVQFEYAARNNVEEAVVTDLAAWVKDRSPVEQ